MAKAKTTKKRGNKTGARGKATKQPRKRSDRKNRATAQKVEADAAHTMRVMLWPPDVWAAVKAAAGKSGLPSRSVVDECVQQEAQALVAVLRELGFKDEPRKRVRQAINQATLSTLRFMSGECGLPMQTLMILAVERHLAKKGGAK